MTDHVSKQLIFGIMGIMSVAMLELAIYALHDFVQKDPDTSMVVIGLDTPLLQRNRQYYVAQKSLPLYKRLKEMADQYNIAVVVVQPTVIRVKEAGIGKLKNAASLWNVADRHLHFDLDRKTWL